jgi:hypothetical protein
MFGGLMTATEGTFALKPITGPTANGSLAAAHVYCDVVDLLPDRGRAQRMVRLFSPAGRPLTNAGAVPEEHVCRNLTARH